MLQSVSRINSQVGSGGSGTVTSVGGADSITTIAPPNPFTTSGTLSLVGDSANPGAGKYYGTDALGAKGFYSLPSGSGIIGSTSGVTSNPAPGASNETWLGEGAGGSGMSTNNTIAIGLSAGRTATNAQGAYFMGTSAGAGATNAFTAIAIGASALDSSPNAANVIAIGTNTGSSDAIDNYTSLPSNYWNILIGNSAGTGSTLVTQNHNSIALGQNAVNTTSNEFVLGSGTISADTIQIVRMGDWGNLINQTKWILNDVNQTINANAIDGTITMQTNMGLNATVLGGKDGVENYYTDSSSTIQSAVIAGDLSGVLTADAGSVNSAFMGSFLDATNRAEQFAYQSATPGNGFTFAANVLNHALGTPTTGAIGINGIEAVLRMVNNNTGVLREFLATPTTIGYSGSSTFILPDADGSANNVMTTDGAGNLTLTNFGYLQNYANNAAAVTAGLVVGDLYYTNVGGDGFVKVVV